MKTFSYTQDYLYVLSVGTVGCRLRLGKEHVPELV
jgi:hypothetical protein